MMEGLFSLIKKYVDKENVTAIFLSANVLLYFLAAMVAGFLFCMITGVTFLQVLTNLMCAGIYVAIIFGLIGGILYLQKKY